MQSLVLVLLLVSLYLTKAEEDEIEYEKRMKAANMALGLIKIFG